MKSEKHVTIQLNENIHKHLHNCIKHDAIKYVVNYSLFHHQIITTTA